jgi:heat shock protein HslJ
MYQDMYEKKGCAWSKPMSRITLVSMMVLLLAQATPGQSSWLDRRLANWNRQSGSLPQLPEPSAAPGARANRCRQQVRQATTPAEKALERRGWLVYGPVYSYDLTKIVTAVSGFDGMCRPLGFQAFVYWEGRYGGTLSPVLMNARADGSLTNIRLVNASTISADFARYRRSDALCCPSRISSVNYSLVRDDVPTLSAASVSHRATCETDQASNQNAENDEPASPLFGKRWTLTQIEERRLSPGRPYIEFAADQTRASGSGGCNSFSGGFEVDGSMLRLSRLTSTRRACLSSELQRIETDFLNLLETTTRFEAQGNRLRLYANERLILGFTTR